MYLPIQAKKQRDFQFDNIRLLLIFFVVFGHCVGTYAQESVLFRFIHTFHMPVFVFISGYFARFDKKKVVFSLFLPYLVFQVLYQIFDIYYAGGDTFRVAYGTVLAALVSFCDTYLLFGVAADNDGTG